MKFLCPNCKAKYQIGPEKLVGRRIAKIRCRKCDYRIQIAPRAGSDEYDITATANSLSPASGGAGASLAPAAAAVSIAPLPPAPAVAPAPPPPPAPVPAPKPVAAAPRIPMPGTPGARMPAAAAAAPRARAADKDDSSTAAGSRKPTAAVPGLPGLGASKLTRSTGARTDLFGAGAAPLGARRPLAAPPGSAMASAAMTPAAAAAAPLPPPPVAPLALAPEVQSPPPAAVAPLPVPAPPPAIPAPPVVAPLASAPLAPAAGLGAALPTAAIAPPAGPVPARPAAGGTQLADQFRQSVQAGGAGAPVEEGPQDGWFVGVNGVPLGPIPVADLRELASAGHIDRKSLVWREGQAEWRPLGKFPFLARVLDDGSGVASRPASTEAEASPPPAVRNPAGNSSAANHSAANHSAANHSAANGQLTASGFEPVRPDARPEKPSAWGDLDEDDDAEEQPTTVKGRVSVPAPAPAGRLSAPGAPGLPPVPPPPVPKPDGGVLGSVPGPASSTGAVSVPPSAADPALGNGLGAAVNALPAADDPDAEMLRDKGRNRTVLVAVAVAAAVAVVAVAWHLMSSSPSSKNAQAPGHTPTASAEQQDQGKKAEPPPPVTPPAQTSPAPTAEAPSDAPIAQIPEPPAAVAKAPTPSPAPTGNAPGAAAPKPAAPSLLSGLSTLQTPGPMAGAKSAGSGATAGVGLDATAIQRTVRKYSPAVRQNCWQRALNARAPGVPSSAKVTATITVDSSGKVQSVTAAGAPRGYPGLAHCIEDAVRGWAFPRSMGETVTNVPFMFVGQ